MYKLKLKSHISISSDTYKFEDIPTLVKYAKNPDLEGWYTGGDYSLHIGKEGTDANVVYSYDRHTHRFWYRSYALNKWINISAKSLPCFTEMCLKRGY